MEMVCTSVITRDTETLTPIFFISLKDIVNHSFLLKLSLI